MAKSAPAPKGLPTEERDALAAQALRTFDGQADTSTRDSMGRDWRFRVELESHVALRLSVARIVPEGEQSQEVSRLVTGSALGAVDTAPEALRAAVAALDVEARGNA